MTDFRPDFYLIPGEIAHDDRIPYAGERLYAVIYWFSRMKQGRCTASNEVLAKYIGNGVTERYVSDILNQLENGGYITRIYEDESKRNRLEIIPNVTFSRNPIEAIVPNDRGDSSLAIEAIVPQISNNYKEKNKYISSLPEKLGKTPLSRLKTAYSRIYKSEFGVVPKIYLNKKDGGVLKSLLKDYSEWQITAFMIEHVLCNDSKLEEAGHPLTWLPMRVNKYIEIISREADMDDPLQVQKYVVDHLKSLK